MYSTESKKHIAARSVLGLTVAIAINPAYAATFTVSKTTDSNTVACIPTSTNCSLREAIIAANNLVGADTINIRAGTYTLSLAGAGEDDAKTGDLDIRDTVTIIGAGRSSTTINASQIDRVFHLTSGVTATIRNLRVQNGLAKSFANGGGLLNHGTATVKNVHFTGNVSSGYGGAIESRGVNYPAFATLTVQNSNFTSNCSDSGGAIDHVGKLTVTNTVFSGNKPVTTAGVTCRNGDGAAIHIQIGDNVTIDKATFINNVGAAGAITIYDGSATVTNSTFTNNQGVGGAYTTGGAGAIENEYNIGIITVKSSTIANNTGKTSGGGTYGAVTLQNTILANNTATNSPNCGGSVTSNGNNIFGDTTGCSVTLQPTDYVGDPSLGTPTKDTPTNQTYIPLLAGSRAIDKANGAACSTYDQLGKSRPVDGDGNGTAICDIGAVEKR